MGHPILFYIKRTRTSQLSCPYTTLYYYYIVLATLLMNQGNKKMLKLCMKRLVCFIITLQQCLKPQLVCSPENKLHKNIYLQFLNIRSLSHLDLNQDLAHKVNHCPYNLTNWVRINRIFFKSISSFSDPTFDFLFYYCPLQVRVFFPLLSLTVARS